MKSYREVAREYPAHPEAKFGAPCLRTTTGTLTRRHVRGERAEYIGKEGNLLDRRAEGAGLAGEVQAVYEDPEDFERYVLPSNQIPFACGCLGQRWDYTERLAGDPFRTQLAKDGDEDTAHAHRRHQKCYPCRCER